jgi:hypothetical protein
VLYGSESGAFKADMKRKKPQPLSDLVKRFLNLGTKDRPSQTIDDNRYRFEEPDDTKVLVFGEGDALRISYRLTPDEVAVLTTLHEVTGTSLELLAQDAFGWTRSYIHDLTEDGTGQLFHLIDEDDGACPIQRGYRHRTTEFLRAVQHAWH